jgi:Cyclin, N-terminal domain
MVHHEPSIRMQQQTNWKLAGTSRFADAYETVVALRGKEAAYRTRNYFSGPTPRRSFKRECTRLVVDPECREKMCEWCYILSECRQFPACREMVAVAFSFLDRYMMQATECDRPTFKLAAVTSFYLATKILSTAQISIFSLVELGRGEYSDADVRDMEKELLEKLAWRLSPLTPQGYIRLLMTIFSKEACVSHALCQKIHDRAIFFAELSVYDHMFIGSERYTVAVCCLLSSMEAVDGELSLEQREVVNAIGAVFGMDQDQRNLERGQARLWYLYSRSAENSSSDILPLVFSEKHMMRIQTAKTADVHECSPQSIRGIDSISTLRQLPICIQSQSGH